MSVHSISQLLYIFMLQVQTAVILTFPETDYYFKRTGTQRGNDIVKMYEMNGSGQENKGENPPTWKEMLLTTVVYRLARLPTEQVVIVSISH